MDLEEELFYEYLGKRISQEKNNANHTQSDISKLLNKTQASISFYEKGKRSISVYDLVKLSKYLRTNLSEFIDEELVE